MHLVYVSNTRLPTEKAHGLALAKLCEAFADTGFQVTVLSPRRLGTSGRDIYDYYRVKRNFKIVFLPCLDLLGLRFFRKVFFILQLTSFSIVAFAYSFIRYRDKEIIFFSHDYFPLYCLSFIPGAKIYYDIHHYPSKSFFYKRVIKKALGFSVQTKWKIEALARDFGIPAEKIVYWPNGTDLGLTIKFPLKLKAREFLRLPLNQKVIVYTGHLFLWKGVESLVRAVAGLSQDTYIYLVGSSLKDELEFKKVIPEANDPRIYFVRFQPREIIPYWLSAADVLVLPNTGKMKVSQFYTSPMKLFDYLAAGRPIVASDLPSIREIVDEKSVFFAQPDNPASLVKAIDFIFVNPEEALKRAQQALVKSKTFTWQARAEKIIEHSKLLQ